MEYSSRKSVVEAIRSYTITRGVAYDVYESEPQTFYAKCKMYGRGYNGRHTCTMGVISQDHSMLDSDTVAEAIRPLVKTDSSIKVKFIIAKVQSRFNYTISYQKAWLAKQKSIAKVFSDWEESFQAFLWWLSVMVQKMSGSSLAKACGQHWVFKNGGGRIEASMQQAGNIVVHRFDRRNEVFEVCKMTSGKVLVLDLARRTCDSGHFQVERIPCRHVIACCVNQRIDWQLYVHDMYKMTEVRKVYRFEFTPLSEAETWLAYEGPTSVANPTLRRTSKDT
ncbi:hypothetical protein Ahy_A07g032677 [Arachis hypogaea]|uniref:Zinc finger PMZ-type domain-containing protein n=1 Tax=Arachis hypogaea TaxID=3818 RepID=A0A445C7B1_ARAHY|nr:hypothetical protein Ahy_A07g032677 [Arachis hypogaea]